MPALNRAPPIRASGATSRRSAASEPRYWPSALARVARQRADRRQRAGRRGREVVPHGQHLLARAAGIGGEEPRGPSQPPRAQVHGGDDREAAAASAQRPEEVVLAVHAPPLAGGRHDVQRGHAVERQTERAAREPHAAAGREPADRHVRARAGRDREPAAREPAVELEVAQPGPDRGDVAVEPEAIEAADVEHDGVAARRRAVVRVAAGAHDQRHVVAAGPAHDGLHVGGVAHAHDRRRPDRVEAPVEHKPRAVVAAVAGREHAPAHRGAQLAQLGGRNPCVGVEREARARRRPPRTLRGNRGGTAAWAHVIRAPCGNVSARRRYSPGANCGI